MATYIGIDISKDTFDAATSEQKQSIIFKNTVAGYKNSKLGFLSLMNLMFAWKQQGNIIWG
jgi:transposase